MPSTRLTDRTLTVVAHLLADPYGDHHIGTTAAATGLPVSQVESSFALLAAHGWAIKVDGGVTGRALRLTSVGRQEGQALVDAGEVGIPLRRLDETDPATADLVRARMGWPPKHA